MEIQRYSAWTGSSDQNPTFGALLGPWFESAKMHFHDAGDQKAYLLPLLGPGSAHASRTLKCIPGDTFRTALSDKIAHASSMLRCIVDDTSRTSLSEKILHASRTLKCFFEETFRTSLSENMRRPRSCSNLSRVKDLGLPSQRIYACLGHAQM